MKGGAFSKSMYSVVKTRNLDKIIKSIDVQKITPHEAAVTLRTVFSMTKSFDSVRPHLQTIRELQRLFYGNIKTLKSGELAHFLYSFRRMKDLARLVPEFSFKEEVVQKVIECVQNRTIDPSCAIQIYIDYTKLEGFNDTLESEILTVLKCEDYPISLTQLKLVMISASEKISYFNNFILHESYKRLDAMTFYETDVEAIIDILNLIFIIQSRLGLDPEKFEKKGIAYLDRLDLKTEDIIKILETYSIAHTNSEVYVNYLRKLADLIDENTRNPILISFLKLHQLNPDIRKNSAERILKIVLSRLKNASRPVDSETCLMLSYLSPLTSAIDQGILNGIHFSPSVPHQLEALSGLSYFPDTDSLISNSLNTLLPTLKPLNSQFVYKSLEKTLLFKSPERYPELQIFQENLINQIKSAVSASKAEAVIFSKIFFQSENEKFKKILESTWEEVLKNYVNIVRLPRNGMLHAGHLIFYLYMFSDNPIWYSYMASISDIFKQEAISEYCRTTCVKDKSFKGLKYFYSTQNRKTHNEIASYIYLLLNQSFSRNRK